MSMLDLKRDGRAVPSADRGTTRYNDREIGLSRRTPSIGNTDNDGSNFFTSNQDSFFGEADDPITQASKKGKAGGIFSDSAFGKGTSFMDFLGGENGITAQEGIALGSVLSDALTGGNKNDLAAVDAQTAAFVGAKEGNLPGQSKKLDPFSFMDKVLLARKRRKQREEERQAIFSFLKGKKSNVDAAASLLEKTK